MPFIPNIILISDLKKIIATVKWLFQYNLPIYFNLHDLSYLHQKGPVQEWSWELTNSYQSRVDGQSQFIFAYF